MDANLKFQAVARARRALVFLVAIYLAMTPFYFWAVSYMRANVAPYDSQRLYPKTIRQFSLTAYVIDVELAFRVGEPDTSEHPDRSTLKLYENGALLGPAHTTHDKIGMGRYSHWSSGREIVMFSTSDNSDPRKNGRVYRITRD